MDGSKINLSRSCNCNSWSSLPAFLCIWITSTKPTTGWICLIMIIFYSDNKVNIVILCYHECIIMILQQSSYRIIAIVTIFICSNLLPSLKISAKISWCWWQSFVYNLAFEWKFLTDCEMMDPRDDDENDDGQDKWSSWDNIYPFTQHSSKEPKEQSVSTKRGQGRMTGNAQLRVDKKQRATYWYKLKIAISHSKTQHT